MGLCGELVLYCGLVANSYRTSSQCLFGFYVSVHIYRTVSHILIDDYNYNKDVYGRVTDWSEWSRCSVSCGSGGYRTRSRECYLDHGVYGNAVCHESLSETGACDPYQSVSFCRKLHRGCYLNTLLRIKIFVPLTPLPIILVTFALQ